MTHPVTPPLHLSPPCVCTVVQCSYSLAPIATHRQGFQAPWAKSSTCVRLHYTRSSLGETKEDQVRLLLQTDETITLRVRPIMNTSRHETPPGDSKCITRDTQTKTASEECSIVCTNFIGQVTIQVIGCSPRDSPSLDSDETTNC